MKIIVMALITFQVFTCLGAEQYKEWKEVKQQQWKIGNVLTLATQASDLVEDILNNLNQLKKNPHNLYHETEALYSYNFLREMLGRPTIANTNTIDRTWLNQVEEVVDPYALMENKSMQAPTQAQIKLFKQAQELLKIEDKIMFFSSTRPEWGETEPFKDYSWLSTCQTPDIDLQLFTLYHELAHILYKDDINRTWIKEGKVSIESFVLEPSFQENLMQIKRYTELGKKAFDTSTPIGKVIHEVLAGLTNAEITNFWIPPKDEKTYKKMIFFRGQESRADLYAVENLFKQKNVNAILQQIARWAADHYIPGQEQYAYAYVKEEDDDHPASFERALYMAGFLVDKGIDINAAFRKWFSTGICTYAQDLPTVSFFQELQAYKGEGAQDFLRANSSWKKENDLHDYRLWKEAKQAEWQAGDVKSLAAQESKLARELLFNLDFIKKYPFVTATYERDNLYSYNFLRELEHKLPVKIASKIDKSWVQAQLAAFERKG